MEAVGTERKPVECEVMREEAASLPTHSPFVTRLAASSFTHLFTHSFLCPFLLHPTSLSRYTRSCREDWRKNDDKMNGTSEVREG